MNINIELININKHFILNSKEYQSKNDKKYDTKILPYCFYSVNEANVSEIIKKIPYYFNNYAVVEDYDFLNISQLNDKNIEIINLTHDKKYLIFQYHRFAFVEFKDFLFKINNPKLIILHSIETFTYILKSLIQLNKHDICYFNLSAKNIVLNLECGEKPFLCNFQHSLLVSKLNETYITNVIADIDDYAYQPLEVHILFYIIKNDLSTISYSFIEEICQVFV